MMARKPKLKKKKSGGRARGRQVVGLHAVSEVFKVRPHEISALWVRKDYEGHEELESFLELAKKNQTFWGTKSLQELDRVASGHQGICVEVTGQPEWGWDDFGSVQKSLVVMLDEVEDPQNLGSVLRTSWLMGVHALFVPERRSAPLSATVCKVASGGAEHVPIVAQTNLSAALKDLKAQGYWVYGLAANTSKNIWQEEYPDKVVWVVGSEAKGLRKPVARECDELLSIPQLEVEASYNAAIAAAMAMAETVRQTSG